MKIKCIVCGEEVKRNQKVISLTNHEDFCISGIPEEKETIASLNFYVSKKTLPQRLKIVHVDCFNSVCGEDFTF